MHGTSGHNTARRVSQEMGTVGRGLLGPWDPGAEIRPRPGSAGLIWCSLTTRGLPWAPCLSRYLPDRPSAPGTFPAHPAWPAPRPPWSPGPPTTCHDSPSAGAARPVGDCAWLVGAPHLPTEVPGVRDPRPPLPRPQVVSQDQRRGAAWAPPLFCICSGGRGQEGQQKAAPTGRTGHGRSASSWEIPAPRPLQSPRVRSRRRTRTPVSPS